MSIQALTADGWKIATVAAIGPASNVTVSAGSAANVDLAVSANPINVKTVIGLASVSGLPDGVVLAGVSYPDLSTVRLRVFNPTASAITVTANSVSASILVKGA